MKIKHFQQQKVLIGYHVWVTFGPGYGPERDYGVYHTREDAGTVIGLAYEMPGANRFRIAEEYKHEMIEVEVEVPDEVAEGA